MKRVGFLWERVLDYDNLLWAYHRAAKGKRGKAEVQAFAARLEENLARLREEVDAGSFAYGRFHSFKVYEPKEREIHAAAFPERVFHHALMRVCDPVFEKRLIHHCYACRCGKGRIKALEAAAGFARANVWYVKMDVRKYFASIPHERVRELLAGIFKDPHVLDAFARILDSHHSSPGRGLPIGSLTSQHLANQFLGSLDRQLCNDKAVRGYARYMDDFVCWGNEKATIMEAAKRASAHLGDLGLELKHPPAAQRTARGMDFLGARVFPSHTRLSRTSKVRYRRKLAKVAGLLDSGAIGGEAAQARLGALCAATLHVRAWEYRREVHSTMWSSAIGHEPGEPGRLLEQQCHQQPLREPQQEQPGQPEQQQRLPPGPQLRPRPPNGEIRCSTGTEPAADPLPGDRDKTNPTLLRASRLVDAKSKTRIGVTFFKRGAHARTLTNHGEYLMVFT